MNASSLRVLDASRPTERQAWLDHWGDWPYHEVQAHPAYVALFTGADGVPSAAVLRSDTGSVLFPFVLRRMPAATGGLTDIVTPYGYGGAFAWNVTDRAALAQEFWDEFAKWSEGHAVVSEFVRLSLFEDALLPYPGAVTVKQDNVVVDLALAPDELWMSFEHKVRKNVNKARRSGITIETDLTGARFEDFERIYASTMDRRGADGGYYFRRDFFDAIHRELPGQFAYFHALDGDTVISTELVLLSKQSSYSFLGGTFEEAFASRPNDLLKVEIMRWSAESGRRWFVLGGGYAPGDGIFRYKRAFAPEGVRPFAVGTRIVDATAYRLLSEDRITAGGEPTKDGFFPAYRA